MALNEQKLLFALRRYGVLPHFFSLDIYPLYLRAVWTIGWTFVDIGSSRPTD